MNQFPAHQLSLVPAGFSFKLEQNVVGELGTRIIRGNAIVSQLGPKGIMNYVLQDAHGDTIMIVDEAAHILNEYSYDAFGNLVIYKEKVANRFKYAGDQYDAFWYGLKTGVADSCKGILESPVAIITLALEIAKINVTAEQLGKALWDGLTGDITYITKHVEVLVPWKSVSKPEAQEYGRHVGNILTDIGSAVLGGKIASTLSKCGGLIKKVVKAFEKIKKEKPKVCNTTKSFKEAKNFLELNEGDLRKVSGGSGKAIKRGADPVSYKRPSQFRKGVRDKVWNNAKNTNGDVIDLLTGKVVGKSEPWNMGHKPGLEFRKHKQSAKERGISRKQFLDEHNNPEHYRPELPSLNRSHKGEYLTNN